MYFKKSNFYFLTIMSQLDWKLNKLMTHLILLVTQINLPQDRIQVPNHLFEKEQIVIQIKFLSIIWILFMNNILNSKSTNISNIINNINIIMIKKERILIEREE